MNARSIVLAFFVAFVVTLLLVAEATADGAPHRTQRPRTTPTSTSSGWTTVHLADGTWD
jgi:hypothetical protein